MSASRPSSGITYAALKSTDVQAIERQGNHLVLRMVNSDPVFVWDFFDLPYENNQVGFGVDQVFWSHAYIASRLQGTSGDDVLVGFTDRANTLNALGGNDTVVGGKANDLIFGGKGDDTLDGGLGDDTYVFTWNDGNDRIEETLPSAGGTDTVEFSNLGWSEASLEWDNTTGDLVVRYYYTNSLRIAHQQDPTRRIEKIQFSDDTTLSWVGNDMVLARLGTDGTERLGINTDGRDTLSGTDLARNHLSGLAGDDIITGGKLDDTLIGGTGNDTLRGGLGSDTYRFSKGDGNDVIEEAQNQGPDRDLIEFTDLNFNEAMVTLNALTGDLLIGYGKSDTLRLSRQNDRDYRIEDIRFADGKALVWDADHLYAAQWGTEGKDALVAIPEWDTRLAGLSGDDTLTGGQGDDRLIGGQGNDILRGGEGADTYVLYKGDGTDVIEESTAISRPFHTDTVKLLNVSSTEVAGVEQQGSDLVLRYGTTDSVRVSKYFEAEANRVELFVFADGISWDVNNIAQRILGTAGDDTLTAIASMSNTLNGLAGNDTLRGSDRADVLIGGTGNDVLLGGAGADTYRFSKGDGEDRIEDSSTGFSDSNTISFADINASDVRAVEQQGSDLVLRYGTSDSLRITKYFAVDNLIGSISFADGKTWSAADIAGRQQGTAQADVLVGISLTANKIDGLDGNDTLIGGDLGDVLSGGRGNDALFGMSGNDTLAGGTGTDRLEGGWGDDTYLFNKGDGNDVVFDADTFFGRDTLKLGAGLSVAGTTLLRQGSDLVLKFSATDSVRIEGFMGYEYGYNAHRIESIAFADGTQWGVTELAARFVQNGTAGNDAFTGFNDQINRINGLSGHDEIHGGERADVLDGGDGMDYLFGEGGNDLLFGGADFDSLNGGAGNDILQGGGSADSLSDYQGNNLLDGGQGNDTLTAGAGNDFLAGGQGNDALITGEGRDIIAFNRGSGQDTVAASKGRDNTLSLGGGIKYADLAFKKVSADLVLSTGNGEQVTFKNWYAGAGNRSVATLQMVIEGTADYSAKSTNKLNNKKIEQFNFDGLVGAFDKARASNPKLNSWSLSQSLLSFHLGGSDSAAIGGDLAYQYGRNGNFATLSADPTQALLASGSFGKDNQTLSANAPARSGVSLI